MVKLSLDKVREWLTPIQACHYLFENADKIDDQELLKELVNLINSLRLSIYVKSFHFEPVSYVFEEKEDGQVGYLALLAYYNKHNYIHVPAAYSMVNLQMLEKNIHENIKFRSLIPDVYSFTEKYQVNKEFVNDDEPFSTSKRLPKECNIHFDVIITSFELGFPKEELDQFIQAQLNPKNKTETQTTSANSLERVSMLKIIYALAKNGYKYPSHGTLKEMLDDFQRNENGVSEKTLKKYLDEFGAL